MLQTNGRTVVYATFISLLMPLAVAEAHTHGRHSSHPHAVHAHGHAHVGRHGRHYAVYYGGAHVIQCVAFAKQDAGIEIRGNARDWWGRAAGVYARGERPEIGSVLSFRANGRMPLGHVAVVSGVADSRTIEIDQSHWGSRGITRDMEVKDVSENNDWSAVRVQLSHGGAYGSIYPTHGFIYPRPDEGSEAPAETRAAPAVLREARADLTPRSIADTPIVTKSMVRPLEEVAEMPATGRGLDLRLSGISADAPDRSFR
jgi:surface antigen